MKTLIRRQETTTPSLTTLKRMLEDPDTSPEIHDAAGHLHSAISTYDAKRKDAERRIETLKAEIKAVPTDTKGLPRGQQSALRNLKRQLKDKLKKEQKSLKLLTNDFDAEKQRRSVLLSRLQHVQQQSEYRTSRVTQSSWNVGYVSEPRLPRLRLWARATIRPSGAVAAFLGCIAVATAVLLIPMQWAFGTYYPNGWQIFGGIALVIVAIGAIVGSCAVGSEASSALRRRFPRKEYRVYRSLMPMEAIPQYSKAYQSEFFDELLVASPNEEHFLTRRIPEMPRIDPVLMGVIYKRGRKPKTLTVSDLDAYLFEITRWGMIEDLAE